MVTAYHNVGDERRFAYWRCACKELFVTDPPETPRPVPDVVSLLQSLFTPPTEPAESKDENAESATEEQPTCPDCGGPTKLLVDPETGKSEYVCAGGSVPKPELQPPDDYDEDDTPEPDGPAKHVEMNHTVVLQLHLPARKVYDMIRPLAEARRDATDAYTTYSDHARRALRVPKDKLADPNTGIHCSRFNAWYPHGYASILAKRDFDAAVALLDAVGNALRLSPESVEEFMNSTLTIEPRPPEVRFFREYILDALAGFRLETDTALRIKNEKRRKVVLATAADRLAEALGLSYRINEKGNLVWCPVVAGKMFLPMYQTEELPQGLMGDRGWLKWIRQQAR